MPSDRLPSSGLLRILQASKRKQVIAEGLDPLFEDLYPAPFSRRIHLVVFIVGVWCFLMAIVLLFTM
jgi:hypothetical protein